MQIQVSWLLVRGSVPFAVRDLEGPVGYAELINPQ